MKKRLLITSIVMMLVVAVALSTATYAWFTSNDSVTANSITMTAATNEEDSLGISWTDGNYTTFIAPVITSTENDSTFVFSPVTPETLSTTGTITTSAVTFQTASAHSAANGFIFNANGTTAAHDAYTWTDNSGHNSFFVKNTSPANALNGDLTITANITGDGAALMRVGVFKYNSATSNYELVGVLANQVAGYEAVAADTTLATETTYYKKVLGKYVAAVAGDATAVAGGVADYVAGTTTAPANTFYTATNENTHATAVYGTIEKDALVNSMSTIDCVESINLASNLAANTAVELKIIAWMDGAALGDAEGGDSANITLNFAVA